MLKIRKTSRFKKDLKRIIKQGYDINLFEEVVRNLVAQIPLEDKYQDHALKGDKLGFRECHIKPDWLLIYLINNEELILTLSRTGSHSDLFE